MEKKNQNNNTVSLVCVCAKRKGFENEKHYRVGLLTTKSEIFKYADRSNYPSGKH
jgi:hypothetical protein